MKKSAKESVKIGVSEDIEKDNVKIMKDRCRSFLNPKIRESHGLWIKCNDDLYVSNCNALAPVNFKEIYKSEIERVDGKYSKYLLKFSDINQIFDDSSYRPLRQLGELVFNSQK